MRPTGRRASPGSVSSSEPREPPMSRAITGMGHSTWGPGSAPSAAVTDAESSTPRAASNSRRFRAGGGSARLRGRRVSSKLKSFVSREGHARVPAGWREDGYRLSDWVKHQRRAFKRGEAADARRARLDALPGWTWNALDQAWEAAFSKLETYAARQGHSQVPFLWREDGFTLGGWVRRQRALQAEGRLADARRERLEAVPGWGWEVLEESWEEGFARLQSFFEREGHTRIPQDWREDGYRLGGWATKQRAGYRRGALSQSRQARLESLSGWNWNPRQAAWEDAFAKLLSFVEREGHARVPAKWREDGYSLGQWVTGRRQANRMGTLDAERRARLEALPGWVWKVNER